MDLNIPVLISLLLTILIGICSVLTYRYLLRRQIDVYSTVRVNKKKVSSRKIPKPRVMKKNEGKIIFCIYLFLYLLENNRTLFGFLFIKLMDH